MVTLDRPGEILSLYSEPEALGNGRVKNPDDIDYHLQSELLAANSRRKNCAVARKFKILLDNNNEEQARTFESFKNHLCFRFSDFAEFYEVPTDNIDMIAFQLIATERFWEKFKQWKNSHLKSTRFSEIIHASDFPVQIDWG